MSRYEVDGNLESEYESGSLVLKNKLGISDLKQMHALEYDLLKQMETWVVENTSKTDALSSKGICLLHKIWFSSIYSWAGNYRTVEISKDGFQFSVSKYIPEQMEAFEERILKQLTPLSKLEPQRFAEALAKVHVEFILIHPFREGNGRLSRVLSNVMALQAGFPPLDYSVLTEKSRYIPAIHAGLSRDYSPMTELFSEILQKTPISKG